MSLMSKKGFLWPTFAKLVFQFHSLHQDAEMNVNYSINTCKTAKKIVGTYAEMNN